jgi:hypothetical protein
MMSNQQTGVEVKVSFFKLAFFLFFCTPQIEIDSNVNQESWGTHFFPLSPGPHTIKIYFKYFFMPHCGANSIDITVNEGQVTRVHYVMPPWMFSKGRIKEVK